MNGLRRLIVEEPVLVQGLVQAALAIGLAFGLGWNEEQVGVVMAFTATALAVMARAMVTPTATVDRQVTQQVRERQYADVQALTPEERATLDELRAQRDRLAAQIEQRRPA